MAVSAEEIEREVRRQVAARGPEKTICPSEVARALGGGEAWRELMDPVREAAFSLADDGELEVTQGGAIVDGRTARGPIRLRRARPPSSSER